MHTNFYIKNIQDILEAEEKEKLMDLYEKNNGFKRFAVRENKENIKLIQLLKIL